MTSPILAQRYRLERKLAQGGMAEVWVATDVALDRQVAVKVLKPSLADDPVLAERFRREAIAVARLNHPNIVAVYDTIEERTETGTRQAVVMQLINGKSLRQLLDEQKRLSPDLTMHIGIHMAAALDHAHTNNLVHRDVKPANILITNDGRVLLTDFGIAKGVDSENSDDLTSPNIMMGTAKYLSPEQVRGRKLDGRADLYSLGLVLYECLAGRVPFLGESDSDTALARLNRDPTDLEKLRPTLPYGLGPLIHKLLSRKPEHRYASGAELKAKLQELQKQPRADHTATGRDATRTSPVVPLGERGTTRRPTGSPTPSSAGTATKPTPGPTTHSRTDPTPSRSSDTPSGRPAGAATDLRDHSRTGQRTTGQQRVVDRDPTPLSTRKPDARPNRDNEQGGGGPTVMVGLLLVLVLLAALALWFTTGRSDDDPVTIGSTVVDDGAPSPSSSGASSGSQPAGSVAPTSPAAIAGAKIFDPDGDATENDDLVGRVIDGDPSTAWTTVCYQDKYLGGKRGVGVVVSLDRSGIGTFDVSLGSAPYQVRVYAVGAKRAPASFEDWGQPIQSFAGSDAGALLRVALAEPARHVLISFQELGQGTTCTSQNPYRGVLAEVGFRPA